MSQHSDRAKHTASKYDFVKVHCPGRNKPRLHISFWNRVFAGKSMAWRGHEPLLCAVPFPHKQNADCDKDTLHEGQLEWFSLQLISAWCSKADPLRLSSGGQNCSRGQEVSHRQRPLWCVSGTEETAKSFCIHVSCNLLTCWTVVFGIAGKVWSNTVWHNGE